MTDLPPARYRVAEQDRRLVVIDTWASGDRPATITPAPGDANAPARPSLLALPVRTRFDGGATLTTHPFYDANGPRTIRLDGFSATLVGAGRYVLFAVVALMLITVVFSPWLLLPAFWFGWSARGWLRTRITAWLDRVEREAG
ncbi:MAG: hypothetical protein V4659_03545 [Pseudomonadota bacterium]